LGLIQLWADTFMMQEDKFPGYQLTFRQLSKEKVKFPPRDPNIRMLMEQFVKDSPMYEYVEQLCNKQIVKEPKQIQA
jgi:hypothetical protein